MQKSTPSSFQSESLFSDPAEAKLMAQGYGFRTSPGKQVVANILAYSKALEVTTSADGRQSDVILN